ncbi:MAG: PAS domain S-box protein [Pseudomonadota bacterium]|nr:PAS domain S-box protein [Pseudomonadota bacterium]
MTGSPPSLAVTRLDRLRSFLRILLPFTGLLGIVAAMHYYSHYATERGKLEAREQLNVALARHMIASDVAAVVTDLMFLAEHIQEQGLLDRDAPEDRRRIGVEFRAFARNKRLYDQIRYLDLNSRETVRVNFNGGDPSIVPEDQLQDKSSRYYAEQALPLGPGEIYLSPLDLNVEKGRIEHPIKPMLRFATPLFDTAGHKRGLLVLNYLGKRLIDNFIRAASNIADHIHLLNGDGYWLYSPDSDDAWGFMFGHDSRFQARFPDQWGAMEKADSGQIGTFRGLFSFTSVRPLATALHAANPRNEAMIGASVEPTPNGSRNGTRWLIVSRVTPDVLGATPLLFVQRHAALYLAMLALIALGSALLARAHLRHRRAEALTEYAQLFRHTLENIDLVAVSIDGGGRVSFCNDHFLDVTGWHRDEVIGGDWAERFVAPEWRAQVDRMIQGSGHPELFPTRHEIAVLTRAGGTRLIASNNTLSFDAHGNFIGITCIGDDITDKRRNEQEVRKLSRAVEQSPSTVIITDDKGVIEYVNPKFTEVTGYQPSEVVGRNPRILKSGETSSEEYKGLWETIHAGDEWRGEFHNRRKDGELYWESASISAIRNPEGAITHFLAVKEDITERKRLEQEVEERNREIGRTQSLTAMGRMSSMVAHDLRNPLSSVKMAVQILSRHARGNREAMELGQIASEQIRYMEDILSDMLTFSRPDALSPEWISVDKLLEGAIGVAQKKIEQSGARVLVDIQAGLPTLYGDPSKLRQVFSNLIVNAAQAASGQANPSVNISAMLQIGEHGTAVRVEICDNGDGVEREARDKLFEPFFTTKTKGTGLGLAIVKRILDQHAADIGLEPMEPHGTCAAVSLSTRAAGPDNGNTAGQPETTTEP